MPQMYEPPICFAMLFVEFSKSHPDGTSTIVGSFDKLMWSVYPWGLNIGVFIGISDGRGQIPLSLRLCTADHEFGDEDGVISEMPFAVQMDDPLISFELGLGFQAVIPSPGIYTMQLVCGHDILMSRRLTFEQVSTGPTP